MAHGSEESEDYWPGYVDALTSMVQVLAFVMMLLAMAVFVLSQNVSKNAVQAIAKAAKIDVPGNASIKELTAKVAEEVAKAQAKIEASEATAASGAAKSTQADSQSGAATAPAEKSADQIAASSSAKSEVSSPPSGTTPDQAQQVASLKPSEQSQSTEGAKAASESPVKNDDAAEKPADAGAKTAAGAQNSAASTVRADHGAATVEAASDKPAVQLHFVTHSYKMDQAGLNDLTGFTTSKDVVEKKPKVIIRAYASTKDGSLSDARRIAYYRAMYVRGEMQKQKLNPADISVKVFDTTTDEMGNTVDIFVGK